MDGNGEWIPWLVQSAWCSGYSTRVEMERATVEDAIRDRATAELEGSDLARALRDVAEVLRRVPDPRSAVARASEIVDEALRWVGPRGPIL